MEAITFGKYSGKEVSEVFESDPSYCKWIVREVSGHDEVVAEVTRLFAQEGRLERAEHLLQRGALAYGDLAKIQEGGALTEKQGQRFMALVEAAVEAGIIEMED